VETADCPLKNKKSSKFSTIFFVLLTILYAIRTKIETTDCLVIVYLEPGGETAGHDDNGILEGEVLQGPLERLEVRNMSIAPDKHCWCKGLGLQ
jgi:hypothetical protein